MIPILILKRDNVTTIIKDWVYSLAPTTVYHNRTGLKIEMYELDYVSKDGSVAYYNYVAENENH